MLFNVPIDYSPAKSAYVQWLEGECRMKLDTCPNKSTCHNLLRVLRVVPLFEIYQIKNCLIIINTQTYFI